MSSGTSSFPPPLFFSLPPHLPSSRWWSGHDSHLHGKMALRPKGPGHHDPEAGCSDWTQHMAVASRVWGVVDADA